MRKQPDSLSGHPKNTIAEKVMLSQAQAIGAISIAVLAALSACKIDGHTSRESLMQDENTPAEVESESFRYECEVDGTRVLSNTVSPEVFMAAYNEAKNYIGGPYWEPDVLYIEYGNDAEDLGPGNHSLTQLSRTDVNARTVTTDDNSMEHELVHWLIGPTQIPLILQEVIASGIEGENTEYSYEDLDREFVSVSHDNGIAVLGSPMTAIRYAALQQVGHRYRNQWQEVLADATELGEDLDFEKLALFLSSYGIEHHILNPTQTGEYKGIIRASNFGRDGFILFRFRKVEDDTSEYPWTGPYNLLFRDIYGNQATMANRSMQGLAFIELPPGLTPDEIDAMMAVFPDGRLERNF